MKYLLFLFIALFTGCKQGNREVEIDDVSLIKQGDAVTKLAQQALGSQLKKAMQEGGPVHAVEFCNTAASEILDTLSLDQEVVRIRRTALRVRNPENEPTFEEKEILITYQDQVTAGKTPEPMVRDLGEGQMLYTKPIMLDNPLCLNCHGTPNAQIAPETYAKIRELYPNDVAVGFEMGELRGMWSLYSQIVK